MKFICAVAVVVAGANSAWSFALLGPGLGGGLYGDAWQVPTIAYGLDGNGTGTDIGTPKNIGEEYRRNTPILNYAFDANFIEFFGDRGIAEVEKAISVYNDLAKTNLSDYPADLSNFPLNTLRENYAAQTLLMLDLKSMTMTSLAEQLGLAEPERYVWCLHDRFLPPGGQCPGSMEYTVIKRNFDPVISSLNDLQYSSFVNGTLYTYEIIENCTSPPQWLADAVEFQVDPLSIAFTSVAGLGDRFGNNQIAGLIPGRYFMGLTRDDVGGLRYLMQAGNVNYEDAGFDTVTVITNSTPQLQFTSDYHLFSVQALTNDAAALSALYPGLVISTTVPFFTNVVTTNTFAYFTNSPYDPAGTPARLVLATNYTTNVATWFHHTFGNVLTGPYYTNALPYYTNGLVSILTTNISGAACGPWSTPGSICTNIAQSALFLTNGNFGDFFIIPTNLCGVSIVATQLVTTVYVTNTLAVATNAIGTTNLLNEEFSQSLIYSYLQHAFIVKPVTCPTNTAALRRGIEAIRFARQNFDSLIGQVQSYEPVTNDYTLVAITNGVATKQHIQRISTQPDILFTAFDHAVGPAGDPGNTMVSRNIVFDTNNVLAQLAGPGTIVSGSTNVERTEIAFNKVGPIYFNTFANAYTFKIAEANQTSMGIWGSFDGSTNAPVVYPNGTSIANLENQILISVSPAGPDLPDGKVGDNYANGFSGFTVTVPTTYGWTTPVSWSLASSSMALPNGLTLNPNGTITGVPTGDLTGIFDIIVRLSDSAIPAHHVDWSYSIRINP
ncbi:MAG TPA: Ig domain-containing protein [Dongiaceae bacterium]|nr:Ig domain-containing protein [Dongiaceae bacterium]